MYLPNEETLNNGTRNYYKSPSNNGYDWDCPICVEFDIQSIEYPLAQRFRMYTSTATGTYALVKSLDSLGISDMDYHHIKAIVTETNGKIFVDGELKVNQTLTIDDKIRINFMQISDAVVPVTNVKNFCIYPIG